MKVQFQDQVVGYRSPKFEYNPKHPAYILDPAQPFKMNAMYCERAWETSKDEPAHLVQTAINVTRIIEVVMLHAYISASGEMRTEVDPEVAMIGTLMTCSWVDQWDFEALSISDCGMKASIPHVNDPSAKFIVTFIPDEVH